MKNYIKPIVLVNDEMFEGVYAASGACYTVTYNMHQTPQEGRGDYRIQMNAVHNADHHGTEQVLTVTFNMPVEFKECAGANATAIVSSGTSISLKYNYHANAQENHGLGDLVVIADAGLAVLGAVLTCNYVCEQHDGLN